MGRYAHNSAGTVIVKYIVGNPNLHFFAGKRVDAVASGKQALFFRFAGSTFNIGLISYTVAESFNFFGFRVVYAQFFNQRMLSGKNNIGNAVNRIRAGGVNRNAFADFREIKAEFQAFAAANPVALHGFNAFRPAFQQIKVFQKFVCVIGNFKEPLFQVLFYYFVVAAPAFAVNNLFVGKYGVAGVAPVNGRFLFNSQAAFVKQFKEPLGPFIIIGFAGSYFAVPVVRKAEAFLLSRHIGNVFHRPFFRRNAVFNSGVFRGHAEGIPAHGVQHVKTVHGTETGYNVADGIVADMAHVQIAGRIREHFQHIRFRAAAVHLCFKSFVFFPISLPFGFNLMGIILFLNHIFQPRK